MVLNWLVKSCLSNYQSQSQSCCGPEVHPGYQFGTKETGVSITTVTGLADGGHGGMWVGPLNPCNS